MDTLTTGDVIPQFSIGVVLFSALLIYISTRLNRFLDAQTNAEAPDYTGIVLGKAVGVILFTVGIFGISTSLISLFM